MADDHDAEKHFDPEQLRLEMGQLVNQAWEAAIAGASPEEQVRLRGVAYALAARLFIAGRRAERPKPEVVERRIREGMARGDDARTIAGVLLHLYEYTDGRPYPPAES